MVSTCQFWQLINLVPNGSCEQKLNNVHLNNFQAALMSYDCAYLMNDDKEMASALRRRSFIDEPIDGPRLQLLLKYVILTMTKLGNIFQKKFYLGVDRQMVHL